MVGRIKPVLCALLSSLLILPVSVIAQEFTRGYSSQETLPKGAIVARVNGNETMVEAASTSSADRILGVVVRGNDTTVSLTSDPSELLVATAGQQEVLVSDVNGAISAGDYLTPGPIRGIAMKADDRQTKTIGQAVQSFSGTSDTIATREVTEEGGDTRSVAIGRIAVDMDVRTNPLTFGVQAPKILVDLAETIADKPVSMPRLWGALGVLLLTFAVGGVIFYSGTRASITAVGRNPLSKPSIMRGFVQMSAICLAIFLIGGFAVYLILRL